MKTPIPYPVSVLTCICIQILSASAGDGPKRISIQPKNDLSVLVTESPTGSGFGSAVDGHNLSKAYQEGHAIGCNNSFYLKRNILVIDDGKTVFSATDKETGLPIIVLTDAKNTKDLQDLVCGYNSAMRSAQGKHQKTEQ